MGYFARSQPRGADAPSPSLSADRDLWALPSGAYLRKSRESLSGAIPRPSSTTATATCAPTVSFGARSATATLSVPSVDDETVETASTVTATVQDNLFAVTGGRIEKAGRTVRSGPTRNTGWRIVVCPYGVGVVTLSARATTDCVDRYAYCDAEGRKFDGNLTVIVQGPWTLLVADAEVEEAEGATLDFVVTLSRARMRTMTVDYATSDGTARAREDYNAASGTVTFNPTDGEDCLGHGAGGLPLPKDRMVQFGRPVGSQVVNAVGVRLGGGRTSQSPLAASRSVATLRASARIGRQAHRRGLRPVVASRNRGGGTQRKRALKRSRPAAKPSTVA